jgi:hypothetical protein
MKVKAPWSVCWLLRKVIILNSYKGYKGEESPPEWTPFHMHVLGRGMEFINSCIIGQSRMAVNINSTWIMTGGDLTTGPAHDIIKSFCAATHPKKIYACILLCRTQTMMTGWGFAGRRFVSLITWRFLPQRATHRNYPKNQIIENYWHDHSFESSCGALSDGRIGFSIFGECIFWK